MSSDVQNDDVVIKVDHVSKCFEMYEKPRHRLQQMLFGRFHTWYKEFWALKDVSFDIHRGECVGLIGRNGSGKSTILQIITGTLQPTEGSITIKPGLRVAALLELGSGFNPEFTGRDNVYMNAAIMGVSKEETTRRFHEIEEFAEIGEFIDQPVKNYSSGMMVRLAFAVQVMVDPDILIVDEALAVGDALFQLKCINRMKELLKKGCTVLFVSHDITTVRMFCNRAVWIRNGKKADDGSTKEVTQKYVEFMFSGDKSESGISKVSGNQERFGVGGAEITSFQLQGESLKETVCFRYGERITLRIFGKITEPGKQEFLASSYSLFDRKGNDIICNTTLDNDLWVDVKGKPAGTEFMFEFSWINELRADEYVLRIQIQDAMMNESDRRFVDYINNVATITTTSDFQIYSAVAPRCQMKANLI